MKYESIREQAMGMPPLRAVQYLLETVEVMTPALAAHHPSMSHALSLHLSSYEARVFALLWDANGKPLCRDRLMTLLYAGQSDDPPAETIIDVYIYKLRQKLDGSDFDIVTVNGFGWYLTRPLAGHLMRTPSNET